MTFTIPSTKEKEEPKISFSDKDLEEWIDENKTVKSDICTIFVGPPKVGKSGTAMDCRNAEEIAQGYKLFVIEMNADNGCRINKKHFHHDDPNIIVLDPRVSTVDLETGDYHVDYKKTLAKIKALIQYVEKNKDKLKIKAVIFDGVDIFLSEICESQMRIEENIDVAGGVQFKYWKKRNAYFYETINMLLNIDIDKYFLTHYKKDSETGESVIGAQKDFPDKVHQIVHFRKDGNKFYAKITEDRRMINDDRLNKDILIGEIVDGKMKWTGLKL